MFSQNLKYLRNKHDMEQIISLQGIVDAFKNDCHNLYDLALFFEVSKSYVLDAIEHYKMKYGLDVYHKGYVIKFEPLQIFEYHNWE